jgi:uncharacterized RDD family membrane protein YckC
MIDQAVVARYCRHCGASLCGPVAYCSSCGQSITDRPVPQEVPTEDRANGATRHYASLWRRLAARTIDVLLIVITYYSASFLVGAVWGSMAGAPPTDEQIATVSNWLFAFAALASVAYLWFGTAAGGTFGQRALGLRIVRKGSDRAPGVMHAFVRMLVSILFSPLLWCLGYMWAIWDADKQTWHDKAAGTIVVSGITLTPRQAAISPAQYA